MNLITIACIGPNNEIGCDNDLIWKFREDLQTFKKITMGHQMVMGLNTFKSLPGMLPGRKHLVLAQSQFDHPDEVEVFSSLEEFLSYAEESSKKNKEEIYIIGGGMIYKLLLPYSKKLILTEVDDKETSNKIDTNKCIYFPKFDRAEWNVESSEDFVDPITNVHYTRNIYIRK